MTTTSLKSPERGTKCYATAGRELTKYKKKISFSRVFLYIYIYIYIMVPSAMLLVGDVRKR